jgi:hypothetical protein
MRTPSRSFKAELETYRKLIAPDRKEQAQHWKYHLITEVLDRWRDHPDVERLWQNISQKLPPEISAGIFIGAVILERVKLEEVAERLPDVPATVAAAKVDLKHHIAAGQFDVVSAEADALNKLMSARVAFSRKNRKAAEGRFMTFLQASFEEMCGQPFRGHVATLTDIAFGGEHPIDAARDAIRRPKR